MNLLFIVSTLAVADGGPPRVIAEVSDRLIKRGHNVRIVARPAIGDVVRMNPSVEVLFSRFSVGNPRSVLRAARDMSKQIAWADCVFVSGVWGPLEGLILRFADWGGKPVHIRICGMLEDYILRRNPWKKWLGRRLFMDYNLCKATGLIVNTRIEETHVGKLGVDTPITVIPNGLELPEDAVRIEREKALKLLGLPFRKSDRVLLYLSRIHPKKGLHLLLRALRSFLAGKPDWVVVVAGSLFEGEGYRATIKKLADASGFSYRIHFVGEVSGEKKDAAFSIADLFVLPSESEGFSNAILEAMAWGIPVVITEGCNFPEVAVEDAGWVVRPDESSIREALSQASLNIEQLPDKGRNARKMIEESYQLDHVVDLYERLATSTAKAG